MPESALLFQELSTLYERDWVWQGWQIRYAFARSPNVSPTATPLLMIHGFGSSFRQWKNNFVPLSQSHPVYGLDLLGFGASEKAATTYQVAYWAQQVHQFWSHFLQCPTILVGHSLGALVAATAAVMYPEMAQGVILMTVPITRQEVVSSPFAQKILGTIEKLAILPPTVRAIFAVARQPSFIRRALQSIYMDAEDVTDELVEQFVTPTRDRGAAQTLCRLTQAATNIDYSQSRSRLLAQLRQPTLVLWGMRDRVVPFQQGQRLAQAFPHLTWHPVEHAGHCLYDERADYINRAILSWIGDRQLASFEPSLKTSPRTSANIQNEDTDQT